MLRSLLAAVLLLSASALAAERYPSGQLPDDVRPTHYKLDLTLLPDQENFSGTAEIEIALKQPTAEIWMHGQELKVSSALFTDADGANIDATFSEIPGSEGVAKLTLARPAQGPTGRVTFVFSAPFNKKLEGVYRTEDAGAYYALSQMEPISARFAFPGFDDPRFKTPYDIALTVREDHVAISNAPEAATERLDGGLKRVRFATTKPLPTYLIALIAGPFDVVTWQPIAKTAIRDREIPLRGIAGKGKGTRMRYALENTAGILTTLEDYFQIPYPFEKLDIIAAQDFSAGAMENAGAIVYRETLLLLDDDAPLSQKRRYASTHAHEIAHHWFGDLVTPVWWNDIWLNESFATWLANKTTSAWDPKGEYDRGSLRGALGAMSIDSRSSARRIAQPIETNDDIDNAFDGITYEKGGGVLSMFEQYYGVEAFRKGVQLHLQRHAWGNATARDFLQSVADASGDAKGVAAFESFLNLPGVPLVRAELKCDAKGARVDVQQSRFLPQTGRLRRTPPQTWKIPLCIAYGDGQSRAQTCSLFEEPKGTIALETKTCPAWIMPNADGAGYYRFALDKARWDAIGIAANQLNDKEVLAVLDSLEANFANNELDARDYLTGVKALMARKDGATWDALRALTSRLVWIKDTLVTARMQPAAQQFIADVYGPRYQELGLDPTTALDRSNPVQATLLREPLVNMIAGQAGLPAARAELARRGAAYLGIGGDGKFHSEVIDANLIDEALDVAVQDGGAPVVEAILARLATERDGTQRSRLLGALNRTTNPALAARARALALSPDLRVNEVPGIVFGSMDERENKADAWAWFKSNYDAIKARMPSFTQGGLAGIGGRFCTLEERDDYKRFFERRVNELSGAPRIYATTLEAIDHCIALVESQRPAAERFFADR